MAWIEEYLPYLIGVLVAVVVISLTAVFLSRRREKPEPVKVPTVVEWPPVRVRKSITSEEAERARRELRTLDVEREILGYAIRRLYEAHSEGKITEAERDRLAAAYKDRMKRVRDAIIRNESLLALHELEDMKYELFKLFNERFDELDSKIAELQARLNIVPEKEKAEPAVKKAPPPKVKEEEKAPVRKRKAAVAKSEAELRIERIREEIERVLQRLGQIEAEA